MDEALEVEVARQLAKEIREVVAAASLRGQFGHQHNYSCEWVKRATYAIVRLDVLRSLSDALHVSEYMQEKYVETSGAHRDCGGFIGYIPFSIMEPGDRAAVRTAKLLQFAEWLDGTSERQRSSATPTQARV